MIETEILHDYTNQARPLLDEMECALTRLGEAEASGEPLIGLVQMVRWFRGCSERFGLVRASLLTDRLETLLDMLRNDMVELDSDTIDLIERGRETLSSLIGEAARESEEKTDVSPILDELEDFLGSMTDWPHGNPEEDVSEEVRVLTELETLANGVGTDTSPTPDAGSTLEETVPHVLTVGLHLSDLEKGVSFWAIRPSIIETVHALRESLSFIGVPGGVRLLKEMERRIARHPEDATGISRDELRGLRLLEHDLRGHYPADTFPSPKRSDRTGALSSG
jgi:chemotaxis protein histidine kinase CheA